MSISQINVILRRIEDAEPESPIAVFRATEEDCACVVFASTVITRAMIRMGDPDLIGVFDKTSDRTVAKRQILAGIKTPPVNPTRTKEPFSAALMRGLSGGPK